MCLEVPLAFRVSQMLMFRYHWRCDNLGWWRMLTNLWTITLLWTTGEHIWGCWNVECAQNCERVFCVWSLFASIYLHLHMCYASICLHGLAHILNYWKHPQPICSTVNKCYVRRLLLFDRGKPTWRKASSCVKQIFNSTSTKSVIFFSPKYSS